MKLAINTTLKMTLNYTERHSGDHADQLLSISTQVYKKRKDVRLYLFGEPELGCNEIKNCLGIKSGSQVQLLRITNTDILDRGSRAINRIHNNVYLTWILL